MGVMGRGGGTVRKRTQTKLIAVSLRHFCLAFCLSVLALHFCSRTRNTKTLDERMREQGGKDANAAVVSMRRMHTPNAGAEKPRWQLPKLVGRAIGQTDRHRGVFRFENLSIRIRSQQQVQAGTLTRIPCKNGNKPNLTQRCQK